jgi:hypothetical protein
VARLILGQLNELAEPELGVARGRFAPGASPLVQVRQEDAEEGGLKLIESRVVAHELEVGLVARAVECQHPDPLREVFVICRDESSVAEAEEVLRRVEAEGRDGRARDPGRAERLGRILDQRHAQLRQLDDWGRPAEQVHRHDRASAIGDSRRGVFGVEVQRRRINVRKDGRRAAAGNRLRGGVEREGGADDLVAGADPHRVEDEHDRVGAVRDTDGALDPEIRSRFLFERLDVGAADERRGVEDGIEPLPQFVGERRVLCLDVNERDLRHGRQV